MGITTGRSCTPDITTTPKAFTQYPQQAAKLLNTPFVGHFKRLESCITRTMVHKENISQSDQKCQGEIYLQLLGGRFDLHSSSNGVLLRSPAVL